MGRFFLHSFSVSLDCCRTRLRNVSGLEFKLINPLLLLEQHIYLVRNLFHDAQKIPLFDRVENETPTKYLSQREVYISSLEETSINNLEMFYSFSQATLYLKKKYNGNLTKIKKMKKIIIEIKRSEWVNFHIPVIPRFLCKNPFHLKVQLANMLHDPISSQERNFWSPLLRKKLHFPRSYKESFIFIAR